MDGLRVTRSLTIPVQELDIRFSPSGGPGGQHANRSNTRVEVRLDLVSSPSLGPRQRARLIAAFGPVVRVVADDERSQSRNRALAIDRLTARLAAALHVERPRRPTAPSKAAKRRRLEAKRRRSDAKRDRQWRPESE